MDTLSASPQCFLTDQPNHFRNNVYSARQFLQTQKIILTSIQSNNRSFSYPDLRADLIDDFQLFRKLFFCQNFLQERVNGLSVMKHGSASVEEKSNGLVDSSPDRPVPMPRKSGQRKQASSATHLTTEDKQAISASCDDSQHLNLTSKFVTNETNCDMETYSAFKPDTPPRRLLLTKHNNQSEVKSSSKDGYHLDHRYSETSSVKTPIKIKTKNSFRSFLKIKNITSNKFLSLRISRNGANGDRSLFRLDNHLSQVGPRRPVRTPPPPPKVQFRPLHPLPENCHESSDSSPSSSRHCIPLHQMSYLSDDLSELYHDSALPEDDIYSSVDENLVKNCQAEAVSESTQNQHDFFYDDEGIYQELSSSSGTIYEEFDDNIYDNVEVVEDELELDKKHLKRQQKVEKVMKRFGFSGNEIPVNAGIVKENQKGSKTDLMVRKGETVLILRMENNPPGKWLAKSERSKIGYIDLDNVFLEADHIKAVIEGLHHFSS